MIHAAFGAPSTVSSQSVMLHSREVEDSFVAEYGYPDFRGVHYCSWSIRGFQRLESTLVVETSGGRLTLTPACGVFEGMDGRIEVTHQLDFDCGFNMAPDYAGAGFAIEYEDLEHAAGGGEPGPSDISKAVELERLIHAAYAAARNTAVFAPIPDGAIAARPGRLEGLGGKSRRLLDLRDCDADTAQAVMREGGDRAWDGFQLLPGQLGAVEQKNREIGVTVPDFAGQTRLIFSGRYGDLIRGMGIRGTAGAALEVMKQAVRERGVGFWSAAAGLTRAGLAPIPSNFTGKVLLHGYIADLAMAVGRLDRLDSLLDMMKSRCPRARIGFHSGMAAEAVNAIAFLDSPVDELSVMTSPGRKETGWPFDLAGGTRITAEIGGAPAAVHRLAAARPEMWAHGAGSVLVGAAADSGVTSGLAEARTREWTRAFPGIPAPNDGA
jgi:hypothetical protein